MTRRFARELALQALFSIEIGRHDPVAVLAESEAHRGIDPHRAFIKELVLGTLEDALDYDTAISAFLEGWTIERIPTVDRLVLRMAFFEMRKHPQTPKAVVINEAVELAKKFSTEASGSFVNGVLAKAGRAVPNG
jgi:transcription antitermination protein NusB